MDGIAATRPKRPDKQRRRLRVSELTEWVIITMLVTAAGMFVVAVGFVIYSVYYFLKKYS